MEHRKGDDPAMIQYLENTIHALWSPLRLKKVETCYKYVLYIKHPENNYIYVYNVVWRTVHIVAACSYGPRGCLRMESTSFELASQHFC